jgi:hypothetical protein
VALMRWKPSPRSAVHPRWNEPACSSNSLAIPAAKRAAGGRPGPLAAVVCGPRAPTIVRYAGEARADLLILTAAHVATAAEAPWGVVSYLVGVWAPCVVLLLK